MIKKTSGRFVASFLVACGVCILLPLHVVKAAPQQECATLSGSGTLVTAGDYAMVYSAIQPVPVCVSAQGGIEHHSGFLSGIAIRPEAVNSAGIPVERTSDNDNDGLSDVDEISGAAFGGHARTDHNLADTDGDGMSDAQEAQHMYDPLDPAHRPWINAITYAQPQMRIEWIGRGGNTTNTIVWSDVLAVGVFTNELVVTNLLSGAAPWYKTTNVYEWNWAGTGRRYYRLKH
ncbi:MAG: hypothetical protein EOM20_16575 [Spartobacteria bacterium]|nr:hypothetical protein [Spartobacteria bacterium]